MQRSVTRLITRKGGLLTTFDGKKRTPFSMVTRGYMRVPRGPRYRVTYTLSPKGPFEVFGASCNQIKNLDFHWFVVTICFLPKAWKEGTRVRRTVTHV